MVHTFLYHPGKRHCMLNIDSLLSINSADSGSAVRATVLNRWRDDSPRAKYGRVTVNWVQCQQLIVLCVHLDGSARLSQRELLKKQEALLSIAPALRYVMNERVKQSGSPSARGRAVGVSGAPSRAGSRASCHIVSGLLVGSNTL